MVEPKATERTFKAMSTFIRKWASADKFEEFIEDYYRTIVIATAEAVEYCATGKVGGWGESEEKTNNDKC